MAFVPNDSNRKFIEFYNVQRLTSSYIASDSQVCISTTLVSLIRRACGIDKELKAFDTTIDENFKNWIFKQNAGKHNRFTPEQMDWLRELKNHVVNSYHIEIEDLDYTPFDEKGGRGKMYQLFGAEMNDIINELNEVLAA